MKDYALLARQAVVAVLTISSNTFWIIPAHAQSDSNAKTKPAIAAQEKNKPSQDEIRVFLRVSRSFLDLLLDDSINLGAPFQQTFDSIQVSGQSKGIAKLKLELIPAKNKIGIVARLDGKLSVELTATASVSSAAGVYQTGFQTQKRFSFDGRDFKQRPAETNAAGKLEVTRVCSRRAGAVGRLVRRVTRRVLNKNLPDFNRRIDQAIEDSNNQAMDDLGTSLINELNKLDRYAEMVDKYFPQARSGRIHLLTTNSHVLAGFGTSNAVFPPFARREVGEPEPEIEVWIRTRPAEERFLKLLAEWEVTHDLLKAYLPEEDANKVAENLTVTSKNGFTLLRVGAKKNKEKQKD